MTLQVNNLVKTYQTPEEPLQVLRGVNMAVQKGEFAALIGASGSGKTTLLNMITAIDKPNNGEVVVGDMNMTRASQRDLIKWRARNIGIVFQFFQLLPTLKVIENIVAPMDLAEVHPRSERYDRALALLDRLGIKDQAYKTPDTLSGGQQQRVAIARALANEPPLILGDELTANLDRMSAKNVFEILQEYANKGAAVLISTYDRDIVQQLPLLYELHDGVVERTTIQASARRRTQELQSVGQHQ